MTDEEIRALVDEFRQKADADPEIRSVMQKIRNQDADFSDTSRMFWRRSELLRNYLQGIVLDLPAGAREQLCTALLNAGYNETNEVMQSVQQALDEPQGIHLNPVLPKRPVERIVQVAHALEDPTVPDDKIVRRAGAPVANVQMSFHDRYIEENAKIRAKLGMKPTITRYGAGCCKWCSEVAGRYRFGDQPKDIFRRHDNCGCTIIYDNQMLRGRETSSGRSKTWEEVDPKSVEKLGFTPTVNSPEQAKKLQEKALEQLTKPGQGDIINSEDMLARRDRNSGVFADLQMPMQKKTIKQIARKYGIDISGLSFKIQRGEEFMRTKNDYFGSTDYDNIGRIDLFPKAFADEEQLVRTMIHERMHVLQLRRYGKEYCIKNLDLMERQAYWFEDVMYPILRKRVNS